MKQIVTALLLLIFMTSFDRAMGLPIDDKPFWSTGLPSAEFVNIQESRLKNARAAIDRMLAVKDKRTVENTLAPLDEAYTYLDSAAQQAGLMQEVHPDKAFRDAAEGIAQKISAFITDLSLNRAV